MSSSVKTRRAYASPRRREQALATRRAVLESARALFVKHGYVTTTIDAIARRAGVSAETVYATFKNKRTLLSTLIDVSIAGDDEPVPILERAWVRQMRDEPDPNVRIRILAKNGRLILERTTPLYEVLRSAAAADAKMASLWERTKAQRFAGQRELLRIIRAAHPLRPPLTAAAAADVLFTIGSPETFRSLTVDRGWSGDRFERWYADTLMQLFFG